MCHCFLYIIFVINLKFNNNKGKGGVRPAAHFYHVCIHDTHATILLAPQEFLLLRLAVSLKTVPKRKNVVVSTINDTSTFLAGITKYDIKFAGFA